LERLREMKVDRACGTWNIRSLYRIGSLKTVASGFVKHNLDLIPVSTIIFMYS